MSKLRVERSRRIVGQDGHIANDIRRPDDVRFERTDIGSDQPEEGILAVRCQGMASIDHPVDGGNHVALFQKQAHEMAADVAVRSRYQYMCHLPAPLCCPLARHLCLFDTGEAGLALGSARTVQTRHFHLGECC